MKFSPEVAEFAAGVLEGIGDLAGDEWVEIRPSVVRVGVQFTIGTWTGGAVRHTRMETIEMIEALVYPREVGREIGGLMKEVFAKERP